VGGGRHRTVAAELGQEAPLGIDGAAARRVLDAIEQAPRVGVVGAALDRQCTLSHLGQHRVGIEALGDPLGEAEPVEGGGGHHHRVDIGLVHARQPGGDVAPQAFEPEVRPRVRQLGPPAQRPAGHGRPRREVGEGRAHQGVAHVGPLGHGTDHQAVRRQRRQVLGRVDCHVGPPLEHGGLDLLDEHPLAAQLPDGNVASAVAAGLDHHRLDLEAGLGLLRQDGDMVRLPAGQGRAPGCDPEPPHP
jgi:hypothetical protein